MAPNRTLLAAALLCFCGHPSAADRPAEKRKTLTVRAIGETGWRTASAPNGFAYAGKSGPGSRWERAWRDSAGTGYQEIIEVNGSSKDWIQHGKDFNAHCNYGPDKILQFTEGSHYGKRSYAWVCLQRVKDALTYEGHYELAVNIPYFNTILINYFVTVRSGRIDFSRFPLNDKSLPGLESYRAFKMTLAPIDPTIPSGPSATPSGQSSTVPLLR